MNAALTIRPARPGDRPAMERICAVTWDWGDYIPEIWDDWLADEQGQLIVGDLEGQVVALSKTTFQPAGQAWLEGMRVDPTCRQRGIAGQFLEYSIAQARARGACVVRLGTSAHNTPVHIIAARAGMERVGAYVLRSAEPLPDGSPLIYLAPVQDARLRAFLAQSPALAHTRGLYSVGWAWQELSEARASQFLAAAQVVVHLAAGSDILALVTVHVDPDGDEMWIGFADGRPQELAELASNIRFNAAQRGIARVRVMVPDLPWLLNAFEAAGYVPGDWEGELWIFERRLDPPGGGDRDR